MVSVDGFMDFRAWIISLGRTNYEAFLNFKQEEELLDYNLELNFAYRADLPFLADDLLEKLNFKKRPSSSNL